MKRSQVILPLFPGSGRDEAGSLRNPVEGWLHR